jgi:hypothetical protein
MTARFSSTFTMRITLALTFWQAPYAVNAGVEIREGL